MNLYDAVNHTINSFVGLRVTHKGGTDIIEKVWIESRGYLVELKYGGTVQMIEVELIEV